MNSKIVLVLGLLISAAFCHPAVREEPNNDIYTEDNVLSSEPSSKQLNIAAFLAPLAQSVLAPLLANIGTGITNAITTTLNNGIMTLLPALRTDMPGAAPYFYTPEVAGYPARRYPAARSEDTLATASQEVAKRPSESEAHPESRKTPN